MSQLFNYFIGIPLALAQVTSNTANEIGSQTTSQFTVLVANFIAAIPLWIAAIVIGFVTYLAAIGVRKAIEVKMAAQGMEEEHKEIQIVASRSAYFVVLTLGITISLSIVGIDLKPIVAAGAFGLGFALQDIIMNTISGVIILLSKHFTIGDVIVVGGVVGRIEEIQTRATIIKDFDGQKVIIPNSSLFKNIVTSKTSNPFRKLSFLMGVGYWENLKEVVELTLAVVNAIPGVLKKPKASVMFTGWGDSSIDFKIKVWIDSKGGKLVKVKNRVIMDLSKAYEEAGIDIPFPIQTIEMAQGDGTESNNPAVKAKVTEIKQRIQNKMMAKSSSGTLTQPIAAPSMSIPSSTPALPTAIATTPNSPGQSWLQQALIQQVASTQPAPIQPTIGMQPAPTQPTEVPPFQPQPIPLPSAPTTNPSEPAVMELPSTGQV